MPIVTGVTHDPDTDAPLTGLWAVRRFTSFSDPTEFVTDPEHNWSLYVAPGRNAALALEATSGDELYWARFTSSDGETVLGPYLFTLTGIREWDDIIANPAPTPTPGGGGMTDGVGSVFFGGNAVAALLDGTRFYSNFIATDEPPRAPQRDDLMIVDPEDDTTIIVVRPGLYDICLNVPVRPIITAFDPNGADPENMFVQLESDIQFEVNGANEPPSYDFNTRAYWTVLQDFYGHTPPCTLSLTYPQVLLEGDTCQLSVRGRQIPGGPILSGTITLDPDITMLVTYRGPVTL